MNDFFSNDYTKGFNQLFAVQAEILKTATEVNKKFALEALKNTRTVLDSFAKNIDNEISRLETKV
jgi:hypothetical protein